MTDQHSLDPARTVLLVMDYQVGIVAGVPHADDLLGRVDAAVRTARDRGAHVGWVRVAFDDNDFDAIPTCSVMAQMATAERRAALHAEAAGSQIHDRLSPQTDDIAVRKTRVGAFTTTDLDRQLRDRGIDTLVLAGISTSGVVLSTVREAMDRDYRIVVLDDASADPDPEVHEFLTRRIFPRHTTVVAVEGLAELWAPS